jgi:hypothetical protein
MKKPEHYQDTEAAWPQFLFQYLPGGGFATSAENRMRPG